MRVIQVINDLELKNGGAQKIACKLASYLGVSGFEIHSIVLKKSRYDKIGYYSISTIFNLYFQLKKLQIKKYELIHVHLFPAVFYVRILQYFWPQTFIIFTEHSTQNNRRNRRLFYLLDRWIYSGLHKVVVISNGVGESLLKYMPTIKDKLVLIYNGIEQAYSKNTEGKSTLQVIDRKNIRAVSIGRLVNMKNFDLLIRYIDSFNKNSKEARINLDIYGEGPEFENLKALINSRDLDNCIMLKGYSDNIDFTSYSTFLLLSEYEGFGLAVLESMSNGLICIVSDVDGLNELCCHKSLNKGIFLVNPNSQDDFNSNLQTVLDNIDLWEIWSLNNIERASYFSDERMFQEYLTLYQNVYKKSRI